MLETLQIGDQILVNKFIYGVKIPFTDKTLIPVKDPEKGEIKQLRSEKELNNNRVTEAVEDRNQMVWIGGFGGELLQYDPSSDKLKV